METSVVGRCLPRYSLFNRIYEEWKPWFPSLVRGRLFMFNRIYEEWKPWQVIRVVVWYKVQSNLWGMETGYHLTNPYSSAVFNRIYEEWKPHNIHSARGLGPSSIESMRNGNNKEPTQSDTRYKSSIESMRNGNGAEPYSLPDLLYLFNRIYEEWKLRAQFEEELVVISSIESMRNGNAFSKMYCHRSSSCSIESMRNGNSPSLLARRGSPVQSNLWGMETLFGLFRLFDLLQFNRIYEEWKHPFCVH